MRKLCVFLMAIMTLSLLVTFAKAEFKPDSGEIKGYMIAEWYYIASHNSGKEDGIEGDRGLWFRRIYFTYGNKLSDTVKMRLRLEMNSPPFESNTLVPYVKDAWINFTLSDGINLKAGILDPPIFTHLEGVWGYRSLEKTPLDLYKWTSSRDFAVGIYGGDKLRWGGYFGQGSSSKGEADNGKKVYAHLEYADKGFNLTVNGHYEHRKEIIDEFLIHPYITYRGDWGRVGIEYAYRDEKIKQEGEDETQNKYNIISAFLVWAASERLELIFRYDMNWGDGYKNAWKGSGINYVPFADKHEFSFLIGALSFNVYKNVWLIPNIKYATYKENKPQAIPLEDYERPGDDLYVNLTMFFKF